MQLQETGLPETTSAGTVTLTLLSPEPDNTFLLPKASRSVPLVMAAEQTDTMGALTLLPLTLLFTFQHSK